ncbi:MAG: RNA-binding protein [Methylococcales bacterium]|nr:MAG: RNA-binding protein [Methylococcales bacterium]
MPTEIESIRLDKWLWTARFFKTRKLAADAVSGGKVHVNKQRTKPGKEVRPGMSLTINKEGLSWDILIIELAKQRKPAKEAVLLYEETPESHEKRQKQLIAQREQRELFPISGQDHKPNKKERRLIHRFKQV